MDLGRYPVTALLAAANVLVFAGGVALGVHGWLVERAAFALGPVLTGEYGRILASGFVHAGPAHLTYNAVFLVLFGRACEEVFGGPRTLAIYLAGVVAGAVAFGVLFPSASAIGASGGVFGLMAAGMLVEPGRPVHRTVLPLPISLVAVVYLLPAVGNAFDLAGNVANIAHVGGAVAGSALAFMWERERAEKGLWAVIGFTVLVLALTGL